MPAGPDGNVEPWDFTDVDRICRVSISGINDIVGVHHEFSNLGGLGILIGDGHLPHDRTGPVNISSGAGFTAVLE